VQNPPPGDLNRPRQQGQKRLPYAEEVVCTCCTTLVISAMTTIARDPRACLVSQIHDLFLLCKKRFFIISKYRYIYRVLNIDEIKKENFAQGHCKKI
jgi:hypothetical protein